MKSSNKIFLEILQDGKVIPGEAAVNQHRLLASKYNFKITPDKKTERKIKWHRPKEHGSIVKVRLSIFEDPDMSKLT